MQGASFWGWMNRQWKVNAISPDPNMLEFTRRGTFFYTEFVSRWNCHPKTDILMKRPTAKGSEPRLVQGNLGSTAQQLCDHGHVTEPQFPHLWSGDKKSTILQVVRVEKGHTPAETGHLEEMPFYLSYAWVSPLQEGRFLICRLQLLLAVIHSGILYKVLSHS